MLCGAGPLVLVAMVIAGTLIPVSAFTWVNQPEKVHACAGGVAKFPWQYDEAVHDVSMVYWRFVKSGGDTVMAHHLKPADEVIYYSDNYRNRATYMDPEVANAGLVLADVTSQDAGEYRVELSGPAGGTDTATLVVHTDLTPRLQVSNDQKEFGETHEVVGSDRTTLTVSTASGLTANISIQIEDGAHVYCHQAMVCSEVLTVADYGTDNLTVTFRFAYDSCPSQNYKVFLKSEGAPVSQVGIIIGIVVVLLIVIIIAIVLWVVLKRRRRPKEQASTLRVVVDPNNAADREYKLGDLHLYQEPLLLDNNQRPETQGQPKAEPAVPEAEPETSLDLVPLAKLYTPPLDMPELAKFNLHFNDNGELRTIDTDSPFEFNFYGGDKSRNQKRYEEIGELITNYVYKFMQERLKLETINIPDEARAGDPNSFFFASRDAWQSDKLMVLIHGSGAVRAGQWARSLIMNHDLDKGTQFPYIHWARSHGYGVVVLNTNQKTDVTSGDRVPCSQSAEAHAEYVWKTFITPAKAKHIAIVGHSYGGCVVVDLADNNDPDFYERVFAIAFTDSVHTINSATRRTKQFFKDHAINWVTSSEARDTTLQSDALDAPRVSAGHREHVWTSHAAKLSIFSYIEEKYQTKIGERELNSD